jgi:hypothetical protein
VARAGKAATGYALRVFPRTINTSTRRQKNQTNIYTYAQPTIKTSASNPGSKFGRQGGSDLDRREQLLATEVAGECADMTDIDKKRGWNEQE